MGSCAWTRCAKRTLESVLAAQQKPDRSWTNSNPESCEDEPLIATAFALQVLRAYAPRKLGF
jgi:hypothetical protein